LLQAPRIDGTLFSTRGDVPYMEDSDPHQLDASERDAVLGDGGVGVLAFAAPSGDAPHSLPVSYGYDADDAALYFRLAVGGDRGKSDLLERPVSFTVHQESEDGYESVVATGTLDPIDEPDVDTTVLDGLSRVQIPLFDVFDRDPRETAFAFFTLDAADATGKRELQRLD
jgi:nitroimidazol reductase NimA-like FMN-containing flavoprotein (pyridoxamine 5'-phosphate oxidase superfamily)